jgi:hypothetical protein
MTPGIMVLSVSVNIQFSWVSQYSPFIQSVIMLGVFMFIFDLLSVIIECCCTLCQDIENCNVCAMTINTMTPSIKTLGISVKIQLKYLAVFLN